MKQEQEKFKELANNCGCLTMITSIQLLYVYRVTLVRFQQVVLATQVATPQDMVPCHQQVLDIQRQGQAILRGDRAIPLQPQDILLVGYPLQLATQLGALLLHQVAPLDTPPNPSQVTPRHQGEVIQVL